MNCKNIKNMIPEYVDSELSINQNKKVEEHIKTCPDCKKYFNEIKGVKEFISSSTFYDLSFDKAKKLAKLVREKSTEMLPVLKPKPVWAKWQFASIISILAILILGVLVLRTYGSYFAPPILMEKAAQETEEFGNGEDKAVEGAVRDEELTEEGIVERELITIKPGVLVPQPIITVSENDYTQNYIDESFTKQQKYEKRIPTEETIEQILPIDSNQVLLIKNEYDKILYKSIKSKVLQFPHFDENLKILESEIYKYLTGQEQLPEKFPLLIFSVEKAKFEGKDAFIISGIGPGKDFEEDKLTKQFICVIEAGTNKILYLKTVD